MSTPTDTDRYLRQNAAFSNAQRKATVLQNLVGDVDPVFSRALAAGAAGAGIEFAADYHDPLEDRSHWLAGPIPNMVEQINPEVPYRCVDTFAVAEECGPILAGRPNGWTALPMNDVATTRSVLERFHQAQLNTGVLLWQTGHGGAAVHRCSSPHAALEALQGVPDVGESGPVRPELSILAAGSVITEAMTQQAAEENEAQSSRTVMAFSYRRPDRVTPDEGEPSLAELVSEIAQQPPEREPIDLTGLELHVVGSGALGQWFLLGPAWADEGSRIVLYDMDPTVDLHNIARQPVLARSVGPNPKVSAAARELQALDRSGHYRPAFRAIRRREDFLSLRLAAAVAALPDNDSARAVSGDAALAEGLPFATAGSSVVGGQAVVCSSKRGACVRCLLGLDDATTSRSPAASCAVQPGSVVGPVMVVAAICLSEIRRHLSGLKFANLRFTTTGRRGNRLERMISHPPNCDHLDTVLRNERPRDNA